MKTLVAAAVALSGLFAAPVLAQGGLPAGASSLNETYGNWVLSCLVQEAAKRCAITHAQQDPQSRQRIFAIELAVTPEGAARGLLVMPFGLKLSEGVELLVPDVAPIELAFSTCVPAGCLVPLTLDKELVASLAKGGTAELRGAAVEGSRAVNFSLPLDGFGAAFARLGSLGN